MANVSNNDRKIKLTKNGKVVKRRSRNPEGNLVVLRPNVCVLWFY